MENNGYRSYWSVLPGEIVHDKSLPIPAKYLYVILSSMAHKNGFCWPSNESIASEIGLSKRRAVELLAMLRDAGYIRILFKPHGNSERRYIYCGMFPDRTDLEPDEDAAGDGGEWCEESQGGGADNRTPPCENSHPPHAKNTFAIRGRTLKEEKQKEQDPPKAPQGEQGVRKKKNDLTEEAKELLRNYAGDDRELAGALGALIEVRTEKKAVNSARAIRTLLSELDRLSGGCREDKLLLIRQSVQNSWKGIFPLRGGAPPDRGIQPGRVVEDKGFPVW